MAADPPNPARTDYPHGVPCWIDLEVTDTDAAIAFYAALFGWSFEDRLPPESPQRYAVATLDGLTVAAVASAPPDATRPPAWNTYVCVDDVDEAAAAVARGGGRLLTAPVDVGPAGRMAAFADPAGAELRLWQPGTNRGAQSVNGEGTWNWSNLRTPSPDTAAELYAAVFGWELEAVDIGGMEAVMVRQPGYGDHLARAEPGIRDRQDGAGAPTGFADAVAWVEAPPADGVARWHVTFAVGDTDAVAASAVALSGAVVVKPYDTGPVRIAVLTDPVGAELTVSHFDPAALTG